MYCLNVSFVVLHRNTTDDTLRQYFEQFGNIVDVVIIRDQKTKESKCFGFITYDHSICVLQALASQPHVIDGRTVDVKRAIPRENKTETAHERTRKLFIAVTKTRNKWNDHGTSGMTTERARNKRNDHGTSGMTTEQARNKRRTSGTNNRTM
eukprot:gene2495-2874_t